MTAGGGSEHEHEREGETRAAPDPGGIRALSLDIDGTLLTPGGRITARTVRAVRAALARGVLVVLCTGREYSGVGDLARELRLDLPAIVRNGAAVQELADGRVLAQRRLPEGTVGRAIALLLDQGATPMLMQGPAAGDDVCTLPPARCTAAVDFYERLWWRSVRYRRVPSVEALAAMTDTTWIGGAGGHAVAFAAYEALGALPGVRRIWTGQDGRVREFAYAAVTPPCSKATALEEFAARQGIGMHEIMAVGDYLNDVEMLRDAGWGVAMGQAPAAVRAVADAITLDNDNDGCALAIERYLLGDAR